MPRLRGTFRLLLAAATLLLASPISAQPALTDVSVALSWLRNGQYYPILTADAKGYFAEEGIRLKVIDGGPGKNPVPLVAAGQAQFGSSTGASIFLAQLAPDPIDVVALGAMIQQNPYVYLTLADPGAPDPTPKDLEGHVVGMQSDGDFILNAIAKHAGFDAGKVKTQTVLATPEPLLVGKVDYFTGMLHNQVYQVEQEIAKPDAPANLKGKVWKAIRASDYGVNGYLDVLFTSRAMIKEKPELVRGFVRAVARGLDFAIRNPAETVALVDAYPAQIERADKLAWRLKVQLPLAQSADTRANGLLWMNPEIWQSQMAFHLESGQITRMLPPESFMTNAFNPAIKSP